MNHEGFRIGISGSYGGLNLGDEAILQAIVQDLRRVGPTEITVFTESVDDTLRRHKVENAVRRADLSREEARNIVRDLDLFVLGGGGLLYDGMIKTYLREVFLAHEAGVPVMTYAISAGPLEEASARDAVRDALNAAAAITVRDRRGLHALEEVGVEREIELTADPALLLEPEPLPEGALAAEGLDPGQRLVGFSVREPGPAAPGLNVEHYHALLADAADFVVDRLEAGVVFIPMEREHLDVQHSHAVVAGMRRAQRATVLKGEYTPGQLIELIRHFDFAVGMRLHFLIFAALARVPFEPLPYATKVSGFLEDMGIEVPPLERLGAGQLIARIDRSWDAWERIRPAVEEALPRMKARARRTPCVAARILGVEMAGCEDG